MIYTLARDDIPLLSQWIKKSKSCDLDFLVETDGFEPSTSCMSSKHSNQLSYASKYEPSCDDLTIIHQNFLFVNT